MTIKQRFRKALFAFFKEEILEAVGNKDIPRWGTNEVVNVEKKNIDFQELTYEIDFDDERVAHDYTPRSIEMVLEKRLMKAKEVMFEETLRFIHTDSRQLFERGLYGRRRIQLSLWVGRVKS